VGATVRYFERRAMIESAYSPPASAVAWLPASPTAYARSASRQFPVLRNIVLRCRAAPSRFCFGSNGSATPRLRAVPGMSCPSPIAPTSETACGVQRLSW
jgi:hypothetical protein